MKYFLITFCLLFVHIDIVLSQAACQWAYIPSSPNAYNYNVSYVANDANGNIIQVGKILGVADMDPGSGVADTAFSLPGYNYFISKTSSSGQMKWIKFFRMLAGGTFDFIGVNVNSNNEIVVVGNYFGLLDLDVTSGIDTVRSHFATYPDYFVAKYDSSCNKIWRFSIGSPSTSNMTAQSVCLNSTNDIVLSVNHSGSNPVDLDPGVGVHNSIGSNANIVCYNNNGEYVWNNNISKTTSYSILNKTIDTDDAGNSYLCSVGYYELTVNKFNSNGVRVWDKTIGNFATNARVNPLSILVEKASGAFFVAGTFGGTVDFDPGTGVVNKTSSSSSYQDGFIAKYDASMNLLWVNHYAGNVEFGKSSLDFAGNDIVAVGQLKGTIDFGNGFLFSSPTQSSAFSIKLNASGTVLNGYKLAATSYYMTVNCTSAQSFVTSGMVIGTVDVDPTSTTLNLTSGNTNNFMAVYGIITPSNKTVNVKLYLEAYYSGAGFMKPVLMNQNQSVNSSITDSIRVELRNANSPYGLIATCQTIVANNGNTTCNFPSLANGLYYIVIKHRNSIETWSSNPVLINTTSVSYDFTTAASKAFGNNMTQVASGVWAIYSGDIVQDQNIDLIDVAPLETDINLFQSGYYSTDLNGDGNVDLLDNAVLESNINAFVFSHHP